MHLTPIPLCCVYIKGELTTPLPRAVEQTNSHGQASDLNKYFDIFDKDRNITKFAVTNGSNQLHLLLIGNRIDAFIETASSMDYRLKSDPCLMEQIQKAPYSYNYEIPVFMAISKKSRYADQLTRFNKIMKDIVEKGIVKKIIKDSLSPAKP